MLIQLTHLAVRSRPKRLSASAFTACTGWPGRAGHVAGLRIATMAVLVLLAMATLLGLLVRGTAAAQFHFGLPGDPDGAARGAAWAVGVLLVLSCLAVPACGALMARRGLPDSAPGQGVGRHGDAPPSAFSWALVLHRRAQATAAAYAREQQQLIAADDLHTGDAVPASSWRGQCAACAAFGGLFDPFDPSFLNRAPSPPFESPGHDALLR